jgi:murein DD-endopeptidase MepM/ murein hydrolase activator NlpD
MRPPLDNWDKVRRGVIKFKQRYTAAVGRDLAGSPHLGIDYIVPVGTPVYAPLTGTCERFTTPIQGNVIYFRTETHLIRFLHLSKFSTQLKKWEVKEGDLIGYTGKTGRAFGAHIHIDISTSLVFSTNIKNYLDPDTFFLPQL